jgi:eukaryotic-like serine/threonine-protein kinase
LIAGERERAEGNLARGTTIGRYIVVELIGRGGMGEVYAAYDPELNRKIAVKLLRAVGGDAPVDDNRRTRLQREAQAIARLSHPNVVVVHDVGTFRDSVFIAMEFIEGDTLGAWMEARPRRYREVLDVFLAAGCGLVAAHEAGLVHRDFKPDNVMITKDGQVRVMDFGLARELIPGVDEPPADPLDVGQMPSSGDHLRTKLTVTGAIMGTPAYAAPEQVLGMGSDARADQFSYCVALYEALYRERPFAGETLIALTENVLAGKVRTPPPEARVPGWIRKPVLRGLSAAPENRFPSLADLFAALGHDPAIKRRRWIAAAAGGLLVAVAAVAAHRVSVSQRTICAGGPSHTAAVWGPGPRDAIRRAFENSGNSRGTVAFAAVSDLFDRYVAEWSGMYTEACEATQVHGEQSSEVLDLRMDCLNERLSSLHALVEAFTGANAAVVGNAVTAASALPALDRCADVAMLRAVIKPPDDPAARSRVTAIREEIARVNALATTGRCDQAVSLGQKVVEEATTLGYLPLKAEALFALGWRGNVCRDIEPGNPKLNDELKGALLVAEASRHDEIAIRASSMMYGSDISMSIFWIRHAEAILSRFPGRHPILEAWIAEGKADVLGNEQGQYGDALKEAQRALNLKTAALGPVHLDTAISQYAVATFLHELGRDVEAEPVIRGARDVYAKLLGDDSPEVALALTEQTEVLTTLGKFNEARASIGRCLAILKSQHASPPYIGYGFLDLGRLQLAEGNPAEARKTIERALDLFGKASVGKLGDARYKGEAEFALARALWASPDDRGRAVALARDARLVFEKAAYPPPRIAEITTWLNDHQKG